MKKHAYLIMAHNNFYITHKLLKLLDDERNDIFVHIDAKVVSPPEHSLSLAATKAALFFLESRLDVRWGMFSQIECEYKLLNCVKGGNYERVHIMSGATLPLVGQDVIHDFFEEKQNADKEFISYYGEDFDAANVDRIRNFYWYMKRRQNFLDVFSKLANPVSRWRHRKDSEYTVRFGSQWCSLTQGFAEYVLENEKLVRRLFAHGLCADEAFMQTLAYNGKFRDKVANDNLTAIDNVRANPYIWTSDDFEELMNGGKFFARKFSVDVDKNIVDMIYDAVSRK